MMDFNWWAILVSVVVLNVIGMLWYGKGLFGAQWMALSGMTEADKAAMNTPEGKKKGMQAVLIGSVIPGIVLIYVFAHIIYTYGATTVVGGLQAGFWMWLGFVATIMLNTVTYERKPFTLYLINVSFYLVALLITGVILAVWR